MKEKKRKERDEYERNLPHQVVGREENISLRTELDQLHRDLSLILEGQQRAKIEGEANELEKRKSTSRRLANDKAKEIIKDNGLEEGMKVRETSIIYEQGKELGRTSQIRDTRHQTNTVRFFLIYTYYLLYKFHQILQRLKLNLYILLGLNNY